MTVMISHVLCVVATLLLIDPSAGQFRYRQPQPSKLQTTYNNPTSFKQTLFDILLRNLLQTSMSANAEQWMIVDDSDAVEEASDRLTAITRYVGVAYNLLKGSPDGDFNRGGVDPGIRDTRVIFNFKYNKNKTAFVNEEVKVPDQVNFQPRSSCSKNSQNNVYSGAKSYQKSLDFGVKAGATISSFRFGLSGAIKKASEETAGNKRIYLDRKEICNLGSVRYLTDARGIHQLSDSFYNRVKELPLTYSVDEYMALIRDWGTDVIIQADVGTKNITRSSSTYVEAFQQLKKGGSGGINFGGEFNGYGGRLELNISKIKISNKNSSSFGSKIDSFTIGTTQKPYPISLTLMRISDALNPEYWTSLPEKGLTYSELGIAQKKMNLEKALADYADYEDVGEIKDPRVLIQFNWPNGKYALPAPATGCPDHWSKGWRKQGTGANYDWSSGIHSRIGVHFKHKTIQSEFCVKTKTDKDLGFDWPEGSYCIARKGGSCPPILPRYGQNPVALGSNFKEGNITWNDRKSFFRRKSSNEQWGVLPDGIYDKDTIVNFCCRSDGAVDSPMILPIGKPFVLYRYGLTCQSVNGTTVREDFIQFDSTSLAFSKSKCAGAHPYDEDCKKDHKIYLCHYSRAI